MTPYLPIILLSALLGTFTTQALEITDDYEQIDLWAPSYLDDYTTNTADDKNAFILCTDVAFTPTTNPTWTSSNPLVTGGNLIFTTAEGYDPVALSFSGGQYQVFSDISSLTLKKLSAVKISNNKYSYTSTNGTSNSTAGGSVIKGSKLTLNNSDVIIKQNSASSNVIGSAYRVRSYCYGGALHLTGAITIDTNSRLQFENNTISATADSTYRGGSTYISNQGTGYSYAYGGAIYSTDSFTISGSDIKAIKNAAKADYGRSARNGETYAYGGAFYGQTILLEENTHISFEQNYAEAKGCSYWSSDSAGNAKGGAIYATSLKINNNSIVSFVNNYVNATDSYTSNANGASFGGAIYAQTLSIQGNDSVSFEGNYETDSSGTRNRSVYVESTITLAAKTGGTITFFDSIYGGSNASFNNAYVDANGQTQQAHGDIIFSGSKSNINNINGIITLYGGSLQVIDGAQLNGKGLTVADGSGAKLVLSGGSMNHSGYNFTFSGGTALELKGSNTITASKLTLGSGVELSVKLSASNKTTAALTMGGTDLATSKLAINFERGDDFTSGTFKIISQSSSSDFTTSSAWTAENVTVKVNGDSSLGSFADLQWKNGTLYYNVGRTIWSNASGDTLWNSTSDNWTMNGRNYAYRDGMDVSFTDVGAGVVQLVGDISPTSIIVENSEGNDYIFAAAAGGGKLVGTTGITKNGTGALTLTTANTHTGATVLNGGTLNVHHSSALGATATAETATVTTATGTTLAVDNKSHVVLAAENDIKGAVSVAEGATLELRNKGYTAESSNIAGTLHFKGAAAATSKVGSLSGTGSVKVEDSSVTVAEIKGYTGKLSVQGNNAALNITKGNYSGAGNIGVIGANAALNMSSSNITLRSGGVLSLTGSITDSVAQAALLDANNVTISNGAELAVKAITVNSPVQNLSAAFTIDTTPSTGYDASRAYNVLAGGKIDAALLTLAAGATYTANAANVSLSDGELTLAITSTSTKRIELNLTLSADYDPAAQVVLFSDVATVNFIRDGITAKSTDGAVYTLSAADYFNSVWINNMTTLVYDSNQKVVYLEGVSNVPEPTTSTLGLLALAALAARRRRK